MEASRDAEVKRVMGCAGPVGEERERQSGVTCSAAAPSADGTELGGDEAT